MLELSESRKLLIAILTFLVLPLSGIAIDIYVPSLPAVSDYFHATNASTQLTITSYMMGLGIFQLIAGPISDSYGRRKPFLASMLVFIIATICIPYVNSIYHLQALRFIQGAALAITVVPMRSVLLDLYEGDALKKMMNYMTMTWSIGPVIAPAIGGYLQHYFGWKASFYLLSIYSISAYFAILKIMPETSQHKHEFSIRTTLQRYRTIFKHPEFLAGLASNCALYSIIIIFSVVGPFLLQESLHMSAVGFGHVSLLLGFAWFSGNMTNRLLFRYEATTKIKMCVLIMLVINLVMMLILGSFTLTIPSIVIPTFLILYFGGIIFPNNFATALTLFPTFTGSTNALFGAMVFFLAGVSGAGATLLTATTGMPIAIAYFFIIIFIMLISFRKNATAQ
jgi:Bcr/CflA subfamily drug resistance transporter